MIVKHVGDIEIRETDDGQLDEVVVHRNDVLFGQYHYYIHPAQKKSDGAYPSRQAQFTGDGDARPCRNHKRLANFKLLHLS
jgi:hypothetical protein